MLGSFAPVPVLQHPLEHATLDTTALVGPVPRRHGMARRVTSVRLATIVLNKARSQHSALPGRTTMPLERGTAQRALLARIAM